MEFLRLGSSFSIRSYSRAGSAISTFDYVQIASTGNAVDFGDLTTAGSENGILHASGNSSSNCHGGL